MAIADLRKIEVIAHRGAPREAPENTMASFKRAAAQGADWIEFDLRRTSDGRGVVIHDAKLNRTTDGKGRIRDYTEAQLREFDAGSWFSPDFAGERVPLFDETLEWAKNAGMPLHVELKDRKLENFTIDCLRNHDMLDRVVISSFNINSLWRVRRIEPHARLAPIIVAHPKIGFLSHELAPEFIQLWSFYTLNRKVVERASGVNIGINAWLVDSFRLLVRAAKRGVSGVVTNEVSLIRRTIDQTKPDRWF
ncbi:MAG: glycerophosphodiester phosphodiesterase family protein [bacterium]